MQDDSPLVRRHERDGVTTLTLNRPAQFNALSEEMLVALGGELDRVADDETVDEALGALTSSICAKNTVAVRTGKAMFHRQLAMPLDEAYAYAGEVMACNMMAEDAGEGIDAFIEKRPPQWRHR